jgi:O-antigen ligase
VTIRPRQTARSDAGFLAPAEAGVLVQSLVLVVFSAWALGGVGSATQDWILAISLLGLVLWARRVRAIGRETWAGYVPAALWIGFVGVAILNPSHAPGPRGEWLPRSGWVPWLPTTVDVSHTLADARLWLVALLQAALLRAMVRTPAAAQRLWMGIAINGFLLAAIGACFHLSGATQVLGVIEPPEPTYFFATFFYKNHWAAYGALCATAALALSLQAWPAALRGHPDARGKAFLFGGAGLLIAVTLPLPGSRAGLLMAAALAGGFVVAMGGTWWRSSVRSGQRPRWIGAGAIVATAVIIAFGASTYAPRAAGDLRRTAEIFDGEKHEDAPGLRLELSRDTWRMAQKRPWFGWGPGTFEIVFPVFQGGYLRGPDAKPRARFEFAHNDWLQLFAETGVAGALLLLVPLGVVMRGSWRRATAAGRFGLLGGGLVLGHALIDFPFHNPAVLVVWVSLLATAQRLGDSGSGGTATGRGTATD